MAEAIRGGRKDDGAHPREAAGRRAEDRACAFLAARGLRVLQRNYRVAGGPGRPAGEIDLVCEDTDGTLVFVEVRARRGTRAGGAAASIGPTKRARLLHAAQAWIATCAEPPPCRFDVVAIDGPRLEWLPAAFDAG
jgi:putative endonuclease